MTRVQERLSSNKQISYPFKENENLGQLPKWMLLDVVLVNANYDGKSTDSSLVCQTMNVHDGEVDLWFKYSCGNEARGFSIPVVLGSDISVGTVGVDEWLYIKFATYGGGSEYSLDLKDGEYPVNAKILESRLVELNKDMKVSSFAGLTGDIKVVDGYNTTARIHDNKVSILIGKGYGLGQYCGNRNTFNCSKAFLFLNGQRANSDGNINIVGGSGVLVNTGSAISINVVSVPAISIKAASSVADVL